MSWERDPLWAKAKLFFERAFGKDRNDPEFGLWCSLGLEVLARAAIAAVSPTLLAESSDDHKYLLHALGRGSAKVARKSIAVAEVLVLCRTLFSQFTEEDKTISSALFNQRNEELHTGAAAFADYSAGRWLAGFYRTCSHLCEAMGETLENLFGPEEATAARATVGSDENDVRQRVQSRVAAHAKVFGGRDPADQEAARAEAEAIGGKLAKERHHRVTCPACKCVATVQGEPFGKEVVETGDGEITVKQAVLPDSFACKVCELRLSGYTELQVAGLGDPHMRRTTMSPEEFYGLYNEDDVAARVQEQRRDDMQEYDNEA